MFLLPRITRVVLWSVTVFFLASCATTSAQELARGKQNFFAQRYATSFQQIKKVAELGNPDAEYALGYMYYYGKGTDQDAHAAKTWISKAAGQGQAQAIQAVQLLDAAEPPTKANVEVGQKNAVDQQATQTVNADDGTRTVALPNFLQPPDTQ